MSRCFPYPPPGYAGKCASNEALILSIKPQRERGEAKSENKKDRRREKKEKNRDEKANGTPFGEKKISTDEKLNQAQKHGNSQAKQESSYEHMEKSSLTEEHGRPCCSSDSTENSGKRIRDSLPAASNNNIRSNGTVIRIRLSAQKRDDPPTPTSSNVTLCSTFGRVDCSSQKADASVKLTPRPHVAPLGTDSVKEAPSCSGKRIHEGSASKDEVKLPRALRKYKGLFENWVPPLLEQEASVEDDDWLFASKEEVREPAKRLKSCKEQVPSSGVPSALHLQQAHFLNDADIYALPFTVPL